MMRNVNRCGHRAAPGVKEKETKYVSNRSNRLRGNINEGSKQMATVHATDVGTIPSADKEPIGITKLFSKISWRILPFLMLCYLIAFLDRINIGYAQLQMKQTLTFSDATYGFGAGIFFVGYFLFEVPSNLLLERIGVRKTLLRIMFTWGIVSTAMAFVQTPMQF